MPGRTARWAPTGASGVAAELPASLALWRRSARPLATQGFYALERLVTGGPRLIGRLFASAAGGATDPSALGEPGRVAVGDLADLVLLDEWGATPSTQQPKGASSSGMLGAPGSVAQLALVAADARVAWTVVGGKVIVREGELLGHDLRALSRTARERAEALWKRL